MKIFGLIAVSIVGALLLLATGDFPAFGDSESPANEGELSSHFIENTVKETKVPNMVTAVLADYRGFDTMFETVVIFVAGIGIIAVLLSARRKPAPAITARPESEDDLIIRMTCKLVLPVIQIFSLYVVAHGHHSPGGGFQGGVMLGASYILLALSCGLPTAKKHLGERKTHHPRGGRDPALRRMGDDLCVLAGGNFLDYSALDGIIPQDEQMARSHSMLWRRDRGRLHRHGDHVRHLRKPLHPRPAEATGSRTDMEAIHRRRLDRGTGRPVLQLLDLRHPDDDRAVGDDREEQPDEEADRDDHLPDRDHPVLRLDRREGGRQHPDPRPRHVYVADEGRRAAGARKRGAD